ncbi:hypothetical protein [Massilia sp. NR 4-1]|uniref:hypothetical protein n=1 Tax=Massilia sp. NR 4-1 TaxID=1678028 RepID=UPI0012373DC7|nr:hypothetical protein [Massilia sp. NR 4-1]
MAKHSVKLIEQLRQSLESLPPPAMEATALSAQQAVTMLAEEVRALQAKGYTYIMIAALLSASGLRISSGTLCTYMSRTRNRDAPKNKSKGRPTTQAIGPGSSDRTSEKEKHGSASTVRPLTQSSAKFTPAPDTDDL